MNNPKNWINFGFAFNAIVLTLVTLFSLPVTDHPMPEKPWLMAVFLSSVFLLEGLTAVILTMLLLAGASLHNLAWPAAAYAFTAVIALAQLIAFPGITAPGGSLGAGPQSAVWLWVAWHTGFPLLLLIYVLSRMRPARSLAEPVTADALPVGLAVLAALFIGLACLRLPDVLPELIDDNRYPLLHASLPGMLVLALNAGTLLALVLATRLREPFDRWLTLSMLAFTLEVVLALSAGARYTLGWYTSRAMSLACASALLVALLAHSFHLYRSAARRTRQLHAEIVRDPLTGLFNRRGLLQQLHIEMERSRRHGRPLGLLFVDMDHFKRINDTLGHAAGDRCLVCAARVLEECANRQCDVVARYGGEEFIVLLPECDLEGAAVVAERIRAGVEEAYDLGLTPCRMTVSVGLVGHPESVQATGEALLDAADAALYEAKRAGRNRIVVAGRRQSDTYPAAGQCNVDLTPGPGQGAPPDTPG